jgi:hypothetical protein
MDGFGDVFRTTTMIAMITMDRLVLRYGDVSGVVMRGHGPPRRHRKGETQDTPRFA